MKRSIATLTLLVIALAGCSMFRPGMPAAPPTDAEARAHLANVVALVATGDISKICELASPVCETDLKNVDLTRIPTKPPVVVGTRVIPSTERDDGSWNVGGYLLQLCGTDGNGQRYASEMLVFQDGDHLISINTLYWLGNRVASDAVTVPAAVAPICP